MKEESILGAFIKALAKSCRAKPQAVHEEAFAIFRMHLDRSGAVPSLADMEIFADAEMARMGITQGAAA